jgi:hypothetical protein
MYFVKSEQDGAQSEDQAVVDEGFAGESTDRSRPSDLDYDECESEGLNGSR